MKTDIIKYLFSAIILVSLAACTKDALDDGPVETVSGGVSIRNGVLESFPAIIENNAAKASVSIPDTGDATPTFDDGDTVRVFNGQADAAYVYKVESERFIPASGAGLPLSAGTPVLMVYPNGIVTSVSGTGTSMNVSVNLPAVQKFTDLKKCNDFPMAAYLGEGISSETTIAFSNLCGIIGFRFSGNAKKGNIREVSLSSESRNLSGPASISIDSGVPVLTPGTEQSGDSASAGVDIDLDNSDENIFTFYLYVPAATYAAKDLQACVKFEEGESAIDRNVYSELSVSPSCIYRASKYFQTLFSGGGVLDGNGSDNDDKYLIATARDLVELSIRAAAGTQTSETDCFIQINDIDMSDLEGTEYAAYKDNFIPIGSEQKKFSGSYDGGGHTISNLKVNATTVDAGLFGYISNGEVKNLKLSNVNIQSTANYTGAIAGRVKGSIINCTVESGSVSGKEYVGGMVGNVKNSSSVVGGSNAASISGAKYIGGIVGFVRKNVQIDSANNTGNITATGYQVGGILGSSIPNETTESTGIVIRNCTCTSKISVCCTSEPGDDSQNKYVGGIAGALGSISYDTGNIGSYSDYKVENCTFSGSIEAGYNKASTKYSGGLLGGIVGCLRNGTVKDCNVRNASIKSLSNISSDFSGNAFMYCGGIAGVLFDSKVDHCLAKKTTVSALRTVGAIAGASGYYGAHITTAYAPKGMDNVISNSLSYQCKVSTSTNSASSQLGGIVGALDGGTVVNCVAYAPGIEGNYSKGKWETMLPIAAIGGIAGQCGNPYGPTASKIYNCSVVIDPDNITKDTDPSITKGSITAKGGYIVNNGGSIAAITNGKPGGGVGGVVGIMSTVTGGNSSKYTDLDIQNCHICVWRDNVIMGMTKSKGASITYVKMTEDNYGTYKFAPIVGRPTIYRNDGVYTYSALNIARCWYWNSMAPVNASEIPPSDATAFEDKLKLKNICSGFLDNYSHGGTGSATKVFTTSTVTSATGWGNADAPLSSAGGVGRVYSYTNNAHYTGENYTIMQRLNHALPTGACSWSLSGNNFSALYLPSSIQDFDLSH